jgi:hypothetical protein
MLVHVSNLLGQIESSKKFAVISIGEAYELNQSQFRQHFEPSDSLTIKTRILNNPIADDQKQSERFRKIVRSRKRPKLYSITDHHLEFVCMGASSE